ncbi:autotransporter assembly complex family protein [Brevundimonas sp.]|uniref:autotransporter assembly complex protein TamA n=1 Tax=Brevundimonas sp. TaxID=1871086 RepID=UPI002D657F45|nr:autotransporter assembly complex family protein [Brevundimonas sp.]HYD27586.1 autotransporter assembly complex family protein [Brevundimonas sp.]
MGRIRFVLAGLAALGVVCASARAHAAPKAVVEGVEDADLRGRIERAIGETDDPAETRFQARRRAAAAAEDAIAALRSEGYYAYEVEPDVSDGDPPQAIVRITPGQRFLVDDPTVEWIATAPDEPSANAARAALKLEPGEPGRAADVLAAEGRAVAALTVRGYADARAADRRVVVDHADSTVRPTYQIDAGSLVRMDGIQLSTEGRTRTRYVQRLAPWREGEVYDPEDVAELERRLLDTQVYDSVTVALAPKEQTTPDGLRPVVVSLADRPKTTLEAGASYSTSEGAGVDLIWNRFNRLGRADTLTLEAHLAEIQQRAVARLSLPHWRKPAQTLVLSTEFIRELTDAYDREALLLRADLKQRIGKTSYLSYGALVDLGTSAELEIDPVTLLPAKLERDIAVISVPASLALDYSDDPLDPKRGWRVSADVQPAYALGDENLWFARAQAQGSIYLPLDSGGRTVAAGRLRMGAILNGRVPEVPPAYRFYSGGGGSVRGYEYQGIGPRLPGSDRPLGGVSLVETSVELRRELFGNWGAAVFVDGGSVGTEAIPDFSIVRFAVGAGVRYKLPFGPIRADVAFPLDRSNDQAAFQVYVSLGQAF